MKEKIGISCDLYKVTKFKEAFKEEGIAIEYEGPILNGVMLLRVFEKREVVALIVKKVQQYFVDKYKKNN